MERPASGFGARESQRVQVGIWYILRAQRGSHIPTLRPKYLPYSYMEPLGSGHGVLWEWSERLGVVLESSCSAVGVLLGSLLRKLWKCSGHSSWQACSCISLECFFLSGSGLLMELSSSALRFIMGYFWSSQRLFKSP